MNCNCNEREEECGCEVKDLGTSCVIYNGDRLEYLDVEKNTNTTVIFDKIDNSFEELREYVINQPATTNAVNIGGGEYIYADKDVLNRLQFKSIVGVGEINVNSTSETIEISADISFDNLIESNSPYITVNEQGGKYSISYNYNLVTSSDNYIQVNALENGTALSLNEAAIQNLIGTVSITSDTLEIENTGTTFNIEVPDDGVKKFYVNNLYTGQTSNGTELKPFKTVAQAITAYIGTGTYMAPQFQSQGAKIIVKRSGNIYVLSDSLLVRGLWLEIEDGATLQTNISNTEYLVDFTQIPNEYTGSFNINIVGQSREGSRISVRRPLIKHDGRGLGGNTRNISIQNLQIDIINTNITEHVIKVDSQATSVEDVGTRISIKNINLFNSAYQAPFIYLRGKGHVVIDSTEVRFKRTSSQEADTQTIPMEVYGGSIDFTGCRIKSFREFQNGTILLGERYIAGVGSIEMKNTAFEGDVESWFVTQGGLLGDPTEVIITNADYYYYANTSKLVGVTGSEPATNLSVINSYFNCSVGQADLTRNNTISTSNYFEGVLREDLLGSTSILTTENSSYKQGTPYLYKVNNNDKTTWERRVVM